MADQRGERPVAVFRIGETIGAWKVSVPAGDREGRLSRLARLVNAVAGVLDGRHRFRAAEMEYARFDASGEQTEFIDDERAEIGSADELASFVEQARDGAIESLFVQLDIRVEVDGVSTWLEDSAELQVSAPGLDDPGTELVFIYRTRAEVFVTAWRENQPHLAKLLADLGRALDGRPQRFESDRHRALLTDDGFAEPADSSEPGRPRAILTGRTITGFDLGGHRLEVTEALAPGLERARYRARSGDRRYLVTLSGPLAVASSTLRRRLDPADPLIAPLVYVGPVELIDGDAALLVEEEPDGRALSSVELGGTDAVVRLGIELAETVARFHAAGNLLGPLRPELIYVDDGGRVSRLCPRTMRFLAATAEPREAALPVFAAVVEAPEDLAGKPVKGSDVFALAATLWWLAGGQQPFGESDGMAGQLRCIALESPNPLADDRLAAILAPALAADPRRRPSAAKLAASLRGLIDHN
jgi:hypothetical protein